MASFGFGKTDSSSTGRQATGVEFPKQFVLDLNRTLGGPLTINDLFRLQPKGRSLFGYNRTQQWEPTGTFNLGFGPPGPMPEAEPGSGLGQTPAPTTPAATPGGIVGQVERRRNRRPDTPEEMQADAAARAAQPTYSLADLESAYFGDPEKAMDLSRLLDKAGLDPSSFTYNDLERAIGKSKKWGFSGRSRGNLGSVLAGLQRDTALGETFAGGKGTGIF